MCGRKGAPGVRLGLLEAKRDAALVAVDFEVDDVDFLALRDDLAGVDVLLAPRHFPDVDQSFSPCFPLVIPAVIGEARHSPTKQRAAGFIDGAALPLECSHPLYTCTEWY